MRGICAAVPLYCFLFQGRRPLHYKLFPGHPNCLALKMTSGSPNVLKRRRKSRFTSATPVQIPPQATSVNPNPAVAALRARVAASNANDSKLPVESSSPPVAQPPQKRRRSRFSQSTTQATPYQKNDATLSVALKAPSIHDAIAPPPPKKSIDVAAIPIAPVSTLRINRNAIKEKKLASVLKISESDMLETDPTQNPYHDPSIRVFDRSIRPSREFNFVEPGEISAMAERKRERVGLDAKHAEYKQRLANGEAEAPHLPVLPPLVEDMRTIIRKVHVPEYEWWDLPFVSDKESPNANSAVNANEADVDMENEIQLRLERITHYIYHPPPITPAIPKQSAPVLPLMLTKKETKKLRRQRRMEAHKEQQEMIAVGLMAPPPPKVKLSNMMRVVASEASADPTKVEAQIRAQIEERRRKHEEQNQARKKTREERHQIAHDKLERDKQSGLVAAIFLVSNLEDPQHRFKVDVNARQLDMTGIVVVFRNCNVVIVEGGNKAIRRYKKLMLRRIDWGSVSKESKRDETDIVPDTDDVTEVSKEAGTNEKITCVLVWEGAISSSSFTEFETIRMRTEGACRSHFRKHHVEHYWDLCIQACPRGNENLGLRKIE